MSASIDGTFLQLINNNIGIPHKISRIYGRSIEEREDLLQEMMYQLWRAFESFDKRAKFSTWMYRVCLNTALTYRRKAGKDKAESISHSHYEIPEPHLENQEETVVLLYDAIASLTPVNKAVILLSLEELSYEEIA